MIPLSFSTNNTPNEITRIRGKILADLMAQDAGFARVPVRSISTKTLKRMLQLYDTWFFSSALLKYYSTFDVTMSSRLLKSAGKFITPGRKNAKTCEIRMSSDFLFRLGTGTYKLNGLIAHSPQEAFLIVFEHELCHAIENAIYGSTGHSSRFMFFAHGIFGHTDTVHSLPTRQQEAAASGIKVGSRVSFSFEGKQLVGYVSYVGKTARVMVPDPRGNYHLESNPHQKFLKYQVPLSMLHVY